MKKPYVLENERVLILVSGGIDSGVVARLCYKALGKDRIKLLFVNKKIWKILLFGYLTKDQL